MSTIVVTNIDATKPNEGEALTQDVRDNFAEIKAQFSNAASDIDSILQYNPSGLYTSIIDIGDWDMDADSSVSVAHNLTLSKIRKVSATIRSDNGLVSADLTYKSAGGTVTYGVSFDTVNVNLNRELGGLFDSVAYDSTTYNRGWIKIEHVA